jgi:hypothetical protein
MAGKTLESARRKESTMTLISKLSLEENTIKGFPYLERLMLKWGSIGVRI